MASINNKVATLETWRVLRRPFSHHHHQQQQKQQLHHSSFAILDLKLKFDGVLAIWQAGNFVCLDSTPTIDSNNRTSQGFIFGQLAHANCVVEVKRRRL